MKTRLSKAAAKALDFRRETGHHVISDPEGNDTEAQMKLFIGLGNPGPKYAGNRHNIGFMALDRIASAHGFTPWKSKFQAEISEGKLGGEKVVLLKPQTFMNNSGQSVGEAMRFYKLSATDIVVLHDELDLAPGKARFKQGGGHAGHNGLRSIHAHVGAEYARIRLGIGHPGHKDAVAGYVLRDFPKADQDWLDDLMRGISDGANDLAKGDSGRFMNAVALRVSPPRSSANPNPKPNKEKTSGAAKREEKAPDAVPDTADASISAPRNKMQQLLDKFK